MKVKKVAYRICLTIVVSFVVISMLLEITYCVLSLVNFDWDAVNYTFEEVQEEFSQYEEDSSFVFVNNSRIYYSDHSVYLDKDYSYDDGSRVQVIGDQVYAIETKGTKNATIYVYQCDSYSGEVTTLYEKSGISYPIEAVFCNEVLYFQYYIDDEAMIASYNVLSNEERLQASGNSCDIMQYYSDCNSGYVEHYESRAGSTKYIGDRYSCSKVESADEYVVTDNALGKTVTLDDDFLRNTEYYKSISKYSYYLSKIRIYGGKAYAAYALVLDSSDRWWGTDTVVLFEIDMENEQLIYKCLRQIGEVQTFGLLRAL